MTRARTKSSRAQTTHHRDYTVERTYNGLLRALEESYERRGKHQIRVADCSAIGKDRSRFHLWFASGTLEKLVPPVEEGWVVEPTETSPRAIVTRVDLDDDILTVEPTAFKSGLRFQQKIRLSAPDFLLQLRNWIAEQQGRPFPQLLQSLEREPLASHSLQSPPYSELSLECLRSAQLQAVASAGRGILQLWGPPGTGKTFTLGKLVPCLVAQGYRVAVLAPTNIATDNAVLAIRQGYIQAQKELPGGHLIRPGTPQLAEPEQYPELLAWQSSLAQAQEEIQKIRLALKECRRELSASDKDAKVTLRYHEEELKSELKALNQYRGEELWNLAKHAKILATTVYSGLHRPEMQAFFSHDKIAVVIDEAGMVPRYVTLPILELLSGGEAPQGVLVNPPSEVTMVFAGDPRQLGPIDQGQNPKDVNRRYWLGESLMEELLKNQGDTRVRQLQEQSRMDLSICRRISKTYYQDTLRTLADEKRPKPPLVDGWPSDGVVILDARKAPLPKDSPPEEQLAHGKKMNQRTLQVGVRLIREALDGRAKSVLWLTPFRDQARLARKLVDVHFSDSDVRAGTVHTAQGGEADLVIFDPVLVRHRWLRGAIGGDIDIERLLNVAVSRGRGQVIVFCTRQDLAKNDLFRRLLHDATVWEP